MSIFKKKLVPIIAVTCAFICFTVLGFVLMNKPEPTLVSAESAPTTYYVEDIGNRQLGVYGNKMTVLASDKLDTSLASGTYTVKASTSATDNKYAGNYYLTSDKGTNANDEGIHFFIAKNDANGIMSFRTVWQGAKINAMGRQGTTNYVGQNPSVTSGGYSFEISSTGVKIIALKGASTSDVPSQVEIDSLNYNDGVQLGVNGEKDDLVVTYGAVETTTGNDFYIKVERIIGTVKTEILNQVVSSTQTVIKNASWNGFHLLAEAGYPLVIGGVNKPINAKLSTASNQTISEVKKVGTKLSEIDLPEGYSFVDDSKEVVAGVGAYAIYTNYYEIKSTASALITGEQTVTNLEDKVNIVNGIRNVHIAYHLGHPAGGYVWNKADASYVTSTSTRYYAAHDTVADDGDIVTGISANDAPGYVANQQESALTNVNNVQTNLNVYDGNISLWASHNTLKTDTGLITEGTVGSSINVAAASINDVIKYRLTVVEGVEYHFNHGSKNFHYPQINNSLGGYSVKLDTANNKVYIGKVAVSGDSKVMDYTGYNGVNGGVIDDVSGDVIITFGVYDTVYNGTDTKGIIFKIEKTDGTSVYENVYIDTAPSTTFASNGNTYFITAINSAYNTKQDAVLAVAGIDAPLFAESEVVKSSATAYVDATLGTVTNLEEGLAFKDTNVVIKEGTNTYEGTKKYYDGKTYDVLIELTAEKADTMTVKLMSQDGTTALDTVELNQYNKTFTLPAQTTGGKIFIGWIYDGKLYNENDVVTYSNTIDEMVFTLAQIDFKIDDLGASVRYAVDENNYGGLRFKLIINMSEYNLYKTYIEGYVENENSGINSVIAPVDTYFDANGMLDSAKAVAKTLDISVSAGVAEDLTYVPFAITDIKYTNFARQFGASAYFTVTYADNETRTITTAFNSNHVKSIYEVAKNILDRHYLDLTAGEGVGIVSEGNATFLSKYVNQVADVVVTENAEADTDEGKITVNKNESGAYDAPYTIEQDSVTANNDGSYDVTLKIDLGENNGFDDDGTLAVLTSGKYVVPTIVTVGDVSYEMTNDNANKVSYVSSSYENGVVTLTIKYRLG